MYDDHLKVLDCISFRKLNSNDMAIRHCGDEREGDAVGDDEKVMIDLARLSPHAHYLCVMVNSFSGQELDDVASAGCHLFDPSNGRDACRIKLTGEKSMDGKTACFMCYLFKVGHEWWLKCVGQGMMGRTAQDCFGDIKQHLLEAQPIAAKEREHAVQTAVVGGGSGDVAITIATCATVVCTPIMVSVTEAAVISAVVVS